MNAFWIILTGSLVASSAALLGCFLILRRMAMVGDAISHAVLPGIVIAYLISGERAGLVPLIGAAMVGVFASVMIEWLYRKARMQSDASIGITFTWLFAIGVILISALSGNVDLDQECVLYGEIAYVPIDRWYLSSGLDLGPRAIWIVGVALLVILAYLKWGYKGLFLTTFDPTFAAAAGISTAFWHYSLMAGVSLTTVVSFESVGAILVVAFLVVPAATAYLLTDKLPQMLLYSVIAGILSSIGGYYLASWYNGSIAGAMTIVAGFLFGLAFLFAPERGVLVRRWKQGDVPSPSSLSGQDFPLSGQ